MQGIVKNKMMLFISTYPNSENEKDGMIQRVKAIDDAFINVERIYLDISFRRMLKKTVQREGLLTVYHINYFIHLLLIIRLLISAKLVYAHSINNAMKVLPAYYFKKIITDMHGVVPEELVFSGNIFLAKLFAFVERVVIRRSFKIISVTNVMSNHFALKYGRDTSRDIVIPIINLKSFECSIFQRTLTTNKVPLVIYAGGIAKWQNIPLMLDVVKNNTQVRYCFLTGDLEGMKKMAASVGLESLDIKSVSTSKVFEYYKDADYGFILRDEHLLNRVACPTKIVEYMSTGVVPIVLSEEIGDLKSMGYRYVTYASFISGQLPNVSELEVMRKVNIVVSTKLAEMMSTGLVTLINCSSNI